MVSASNVIDGNDEFVGDNEEVSSTMPRPNPTVRNRWRKLKNTVSIAKKLSFNSRMKDEFLEDEIINPSQESELSNENEGEFSKQSSKSVPNYKNVPKNSVNNKTRPSNQGFKPNGRAGLLMFKIKQDRSLILFFSDFYVACLKTSPMIFLAGIFSAPLILGLLFTPFFLLDINGLQFDEKIFENISNNGEIDHSIHKTCSIFINIFLYALSLSTTFGGSPITPISPYSLLLSNLNTLFSQFLFVFLSGAVFARMAQPSQPIKCSKKAIIRNEDFVFSDNEVISDKHKVFAMRLVLAGPHPCELIDVKINCTLRLCQQASTICNTKSSNEEGEKKKKDDNENPSLHQHQNDNFDHNNDNKIDDNNNKNTNNDNDENNNNNNNNGLNSKQHVSMFVSTHDLPLVRSEISYLRYGLMCRHIINSDSILFGLSKEDLIEKDACFSITIVGTEKTSMQSIFHMQDYFVYDGDVVWDSDFVDLVSINKKGYRVIDHSKLDMLRTFKVGGLVSQAITRMANMSHHRTANDDNNSNNNNNNKNNDHDNDNNDRINNKSNNIQWMRAASLVTNSDFGKMSTETKDCQDESGPDLSASSVEREKGEELKDENENNDDEENSGDLNGSNGNLAIKIKSIIRDGLHKRILSQDP